jgi:hypothetical protein
MEYQEAKKGSKGTVLLLPFDEHGTCLSDLSQNLGSRKKIWITTGRLLLKERPFSGKEGREIRDINKRKQKDVPLLSLKCCCIIIIKM